MVQICVVCISPTATYYMHCCSINFTQRANFYLIFELINHILVKHTSKFCKYQHISTDGVHYAPPSHPFHSSQLKELPHFC